MGSANERRPESGNKNGIKMVENGSENGREDESVNQVEGIHGELKNYACEAGGCGPTPSALMLENSCPGGLGIRGGKEWQETN